MNATLQMEAVITIVLKPLKAFTAAVTKDITWIEIDLTAAVRVYLHTTIVIVICVLEYIYLSVFIQTLMSVRVMS